MVHTFKTYLLAAKNIIFPPLCFHCEGKTSSEYLCFDCQNQIEFLFPPLCDLCSTPIPAAGLNICGNCRRKNYAYHKLISATRYKNPIAGLIHYFKYKNCDYLAGFFSRLMITHLSRTGFTGGEYDFITCVPMHPLKIKQRGYNQSALLAKILADHFQKPLKDDIIYEKKLKISQTKLTRKDRKTNAKDIFTVTENLKNKKIIVIDDIFTTGATANACALALKEKGAEKITVITLSKTP